ncbi:hypothetical protein PQC53_31860 (plasmid) [Pseudomonas aeruginosa]|nr:hypothetical protein PQC53_31860 [Pseudomonas aeruginosa]
MTPSEYATAGNLPLQSLASLPLWELARYIEASSPVQRQMILQALRSMR